MLFLSSFFNYFIFGNEWSSFRRVIAGAVGITGMTATVSSAAVSRTPLPGDANKGATLSPPNGNVCSPRGVLSLILRVGPHSLSL